MVIGSDEYRKMLDGAIAGLVFAWLYNMFVGV
jgi:hypothetical protein